MSENSAFEKFGLDAFARANLEVVASLVKNNNWDWLHVNSGMERSGKSSLALLQANYLSRHAKNPLFFDWENFSTLFFYEPRLSEKLLKIPDKSVVIIDEGGEVLFSRLSMHRGVIRAIQALMTYGAKNIFLIINIPNWRWLDKYLREARIRSLCEVWTIPDFSRGVRERGFYSMFSRRRVLEMSVFERKVEPNFSGRFLDASQILLDEWALYQKKKFEYLDAKKTREEKREEAREEKREGRDGKRLEVKELEEEKLRRAKLRRDEEILFGNIKF